MLITGFVMMARPAFSEEALIYYGALNSEENQLQARQTLERAITEQGISILDSFGKDQPYPPDYYYWRFILDISGRQDAYAALQAAFHQKDIFGFKISVQKVDFYLIGHTLVGWGHLGDVILRSSNFDTRSFNALSDVDAYSREKSASFENFFWTAFLDYIREVNTDLANTLNEKKEDFREMLLAHAVTMHLGDGERVSYRVLRFYNRLSPSRAFVIPLPRLDRGINHRIHNNPMRSGLFK